MAISIARPLIALTVLAMLASACGSIGGSTEYEQSTADDRLGSETEAGGATSTTAATTPTGDDGLIDTDALLASYGFAVCRGEAEPGQITADRGQDIIHGAVDAAIAAGGSPGGDGRKASLSMFVLDEASLATLAELAEPSEVCVQGQDPNDYVEQGPQAMAGDGWRWVGAGSFQTGNWLGLIDNEQEYDLLWPQLGHGPESDRPDVDFDRELILTITHGSGVNFGRCGHRFDGYRVIDGVLVIDWFTPGGETACLAAFFPATYAVAVAVDRQLTGPPPLTVAFRSGPRQPARDQQTVDVGSFAIVNDEPPREEEENLDGQEQTQPTTAPQPVAPVPATAVPLDVEFEAGPTADPRFVDRAAGPDRSGFEIPVPPGWETTSGPDSVSASITGRGDLTVRFYPLDDLAWRAGVNPTADQQVTSGPVALAVPLHRTTSGTTAATGQAVPGHEYRFASTTNFGRQIVRWYELDGMIVVAVLSYPDPVEVPEALTGLQPEEILDDIRLFES